ncbi:MAG: sugar phosphate isomerase/epimerase family protein [Saprospiraceae bacterium]
MPNLLLFVLIFISGILTSCKNPTENNKIQTTLQDSLPNPIYSYSLAQWSLSESIQNKKLDPLDFASKARELGFEGIEYVSTFYRGKALDTAYLDKLKMNAEINKVKSILIMVDEEGDMGYLDESKRNKAVENHYKWVDAANYLGCHSIRVNAFGEGSETEVSDAMVLALKKLSVYAKKKNINILVENHGGYSSHGVWLSSIISRVNMPNCGTLPDFGNFCIKREDGDKWAKPCILEYDKYKGVYELMKFAKGLSAKSYAFDVNGNETTIDYAQMANIVKKSNYSGYIGIEWEGKDLPEEEGIKATLALVKKHF